MAAAPSSKAISVLKPVKPLEVPPLPGAIITLSESPLNRIFPSASETIHAPGDAGGSTALSPGRGPLKNLR